MLGFWKNDIEPFLNTYATYDLCKPDYDKFMNISGVKDQGYILTTDKNKKYQVGVKKIKNIKYNSSKKMCEGQCLVPPYHNSSQDLTYDCEWKPNLILKDPLYYPVIKINTKRSKSFCNSQKKDSCRYGCRWSTDLGCLPDDNFIPYNLPLFKGKPKRSVFAPKL